MNKQLRKYDEQGCNLLKGKITGSSYIKDLQEALAASGKSYSNGYVCRVVGGFSYNNDVWDAVKEVVSRRSEAKKKNLADILLID